jgi:hypothetical protein
VVQPTTYNNYCVKIENFNDFPDYEFLLALWPRRGIKNDANLYDLKENICQSINPGFEGTRRLYAINKAELNKIQNLSAQDFDPTNGNPPFSTIIPFHSEIGAWGDSEKKYNKIESIIKIVKIGETEGILSRTNINIDENQNTSVIFKDNDNIMKNITFILVIFGIFIIFVVILFKRKKKTNKKF